MLNPFLNRIVTALLIAGAVLGATVAPAVADAGDVSELDSLYRDLADPENSEWQRAEDEIRARLFETGSETLNLLLQRGYEALEAGEFTTAIEHFTALTDHAPDVAEGFNGRATAYFFAGRFGPSMEDISRVLELEPRHFGAMIGLARILEDTGFLKEALEVNRQVAILHPHHLGVAEVIEKLEAQVGGISL